MFKWKIGNEFSFSLVDVSGKRVAVSDWPKFQETFLSQISLLNELLDNGFADVNDDCFEVDIVNVLRLTDVEKEILGLPDSYPFEIYIQSDGQLNQNSFRFKYGFYDFTPNGNLFPVKKTGPILQIEGSEYLLSENQFKICQALDQFNQLPEAEKGFHNNLKSFADIKAFATDAAILLDSYLQQQNVLCPDKIRIDVEFRNGVLEVLPVVDIDNPGGFLKAFDRYPVVKDIYPIGDGNGTTRVLINSEQRIELEKIKKARKITNAEDISQIIQHPDHFFDTDVVDLEVFYSERVKEIGLYHPKFYPFVCPYKSEWIPGIGVKDAVHGDKNIFFKTDDELKEFEAKTINSGSEGRQTVAWRDCEIPIEAANRFINIAKKQFESPVHPIEEKEKTEGKTEPVLIIKENAHVLEYIESEGTPMAIEHHFTSVNNLHPSFSLKQHQVEGIAWLQSLHKENLRGCLLADDMGLGKTLQLLYFFEWHAQRSKSLKPYLIVAPVSLLENWQNEYAKYFAPCNLAVRMLDRDCGLTKGFDEFKNRRQANSLQHKQILLANYETVRAYQATLCLIDFAVVALDEAQRIKTPGTLITNASKALKADFKIALTGTPVENTLVDLWCIMDFSVPGLLGNALDFAREFQKPLNSDGVDLNAVGENLREKIGVFIKRRLKKDVAKDLPSKLEHKSGFYRREMPPIQLERYKTEMESAKNSTLNGASRRNQVLKSLWAIRDISDHPFLVDSQVLNFEIEELISASAKLLILRDILYEVQSKHEKAIIFADRKETQKLLQKVVYEVFGCFPSIINGDTPTTKHGEGKAKLSRQQTIDRFQAEEGFNVIVMSQLAAGVGLNVTKANHVIHFTRHWNPAKEQQATDRAYRIGQTKDVHVYYPMAVFPDDMVDADGTRQKSFDEVLDNLLSLKTNLATSSLFPTEQAEVNPDEIFGNVFGFKTEIAGTPLTLRQVDTLNPNLFEAYIATLYSRMGFDIFLTPNSNDKGADVVAIGPNESFLLQAKQTISSVDNSAIQEIFAAKNYYRGKFAQEFKLAVVTNGRFTSSAAVLAKANGDNLLSRLELAKMVSAYNIDIRDIYNVEGLRMSKV